MKNLVLQISFEYLRYYFVLIPTLVIDYDGKYDDKSVSIAWLKWGVTISKKGN